MVEDPRKELQMSGLFNSTVQNRKVEWIAFPKPQLSGEGPLQQNSPECLEWIIKLHSEPGSGLLNIWSPDHTALIHAAHVEKGMAGTSSLQRDTSYGLSTVTLSCYYVVCGLGKFWIHCTGSTFWKVLKALLKDPNIQESQNHRMENR